MKCLNENCLLNEKHKCGSPMVDDERFTCEGKDKVQNKQNTMNGWNNAIKIEVSKHEQAREKKRAEVGGMG